MKNNKNNKYHGTGPQASNGGNQSMDNRATSSERTLLKRYGASVLIGLTGIVLSLAAFFLVGEWETKWRKFDFDRLAEARCSSFKIGISHYLHELAALKRFYDGSQFVSREEFVQFVTPILDNNQDLRGFVWAPFVTDANRNAFEQILQAEGWANYLVHDSSAPGEFEIATHRKEYYPVLYRVPQLEWAFGLDQLSIFFRREALEQARDLNEIVITRPTVFPGEQTDRFGAIAFAPIYKKGLPITTVEERRAAIEGVIICAMRAGDLMESIIGKQQPGGTDIYVSDRSAPEGERFLFQHRARLRDPGENDSPRKVEGSFGMSFDTSFNVANRIWEMRCTPSSGYLASHSLWIHWVLLLSGLILTSLLVLFTYTRQNRMTIVEELVDERTAELRASEQQQKAMNQQLVASEQQLKASNQQLIAGEQQLRASNLELIQSQQKLALHLQNTPLGVIQWDENFKVSEWNDAAEKIFGFTRDEAIGQYAAGLILSESVREITDKVWRDLITQKGGVRSTNENTTKDKKTILCDWYNTPLVGDSGKTIGVASLVMDITDRKQAEEALVRSEERFDLAMSVANDGIWDWDLTTNVVYFDSRYFTMAGYDVNEFSHTLEEFQKRLHPDDLEQVMDTSDKYLKGRIDNFYVEFRFLHKDGSWFWIQGRGKVVTRDKDGKPLRFVGTHSDITDRKQFEEALKKSEERNRHLVESIQDIIYTISPEGEVTSMSPAFEVVTGWTKSDWKGKSIEQLMHLDDVPGARKLFAEFLEGAEPVAHELRVKAKSGEYLIFEFQDTVVRQDGKVVEMLGCARDITDRKKAEKELGKSEERLRLLVDNMGDMISQHLPDSTVTYVSPSCKPLLGYKAGELLNTLSSELIHPEDMEETWAVINDAISNRADNYHLQHRLKHKDGRYIWAETVARLIYGHDGSLSEIQCNVRDITNRKKAEEANVRLSRAIEQADETIVITDAEGTIQYVNPAFEKITGYTAKEAIGQNPRVLKSGQHDDAFYKRMWGALLSGHEWRGELINKKKDGTLFTENAIISPVFDSQGKIVNYVAAKNDITETKRLQALESRAERLETAGTIAGQVAHDFNNLLAPIMAYPEFIHEELSHDNRAHAYLDAIEAAAEKIANINQDLLTMGRRGHYNQDVLDLNRVALQAAQEMESRTETVMVEMVLCEDLMKIKGGSAQIHRMLTNLLVNAQDAMEAIGQVTIRTENYYADDTSVAFGRVPKGEYIKLTISDTGCGIPDEIIQKILDPFFSTKTANKKRGSGLGLSVVDAVMKDHGGYLDMSSEVGIGTSFYLYFPVTREDVGEEDSESLAGGTETVLVVDDDEIQREVSLQLLAKLGYKISSVESGEKAIEFLRENIQDIVILDMVMPGGIDGAETYRQILKINPQQKAIILSGFSESDRVNEVQKLGAGAFVKKPVTKSVIAAAVRTELDR